MRLGAVQYAIICTDDNSSWVGVTVSEPETAVFLMRKTPGITPTLQHVCREQPLGTATLEAGAAADTGRMTSQSYILRSHVTWSFDVEDRC